ncbi:hypothetical protein J2S43_003974 [Catenuloplanes nepalensis]|uniref:Extracellular repeat protein, HAF family n=1 Tax=Catenuloplanes nepalensis TaxID=587533 RepID=A0ABT9MVI7_9ACTN|nr:hypothetical protein [Catenuloplanes nepalensis]MDP9795462.1 hypothetical protein [Catenuloplanes nepalensis]
MLATAGLVGAVALTATPATAAPAEGAAGKCRISYLPVPDGADRYGVVIAGGDVTGRYAVGSVTYGFNTEQVIWRNGAVSMPSLPFGEGTLADVNSSGVAVGYGLTMNYDSVPVSWSEATGLRELTVPEEGWSGQAAAINSRGDIAGTVYDRNDYDGTQVAVVWPADAPGTVEVMPADGPHYAADIDEDGTVLAHAGSFVWSPGASAVWDRTGDEVQQLGERSFASQISGGYVLRSRDTDEGTRYVVQDLDGASRDVRHLEISAALNRHGDVAGQGTVIERRNGSTIPLQLPAGTVAWVTALSDTGTAYGTAAGLPAMWQNCR